NKPIYILNTAGYYDSLDAFFKHMKKEGFLKAGDEDIYQIYDTPAALLEAIY
ncbi:MAG: LOG family protein, partial [Lachnospiraceae bacterium]|nr:LOG family protein [Candidatus Equihabitans merdae]